MDLKGFSNPKAWHQYPRGSVLMVPGPRGGFYAMRAEMPDAFDAADLLVTLPRKATGGGGVIFSHSDPSVTDQRGCYPSLDVTDGTRLNINGAAGLFLTADVGRLEPGDIVLRENGRLLACRRNDDPTLFLCPLEGERVGKLVQASAHAHYVASRGSWIQPEFPDIEVTFPSEMRIHVINI